MQRNVTDILRDWFYQLPNGYAIQPYNKMELQVLSRILTENNIDPKPIIRSLRNEAPVDYIPHEPEEVETTPSVATTNLHETFYALALAYIIELAPPVKITPGEDYTQNVQISTPEIETIEDFELIGQGAAGTLKDADVTTDNAINHLVGAKHTSDDVAKKQGQKKGDTVYLKDGKFTKTFYAQWEDAFDAAHMTKNKIDQLYQPTSYVKSYRVASGIDLGVSDDVVQILVNGEKEDVWISLKYGAGQFGSLSVGKILKMLYGFDTEIADSNYDGVLNYMYKTQAGAKKAIDAGLQYYVGQINGWIKDRLKNGDMPKEVQDILSDPKWDNQSSDISWEPEWNDLGRGSGTIPYMYRKIYSEMPNDIKKKIIANRASNLHPPLEVLFTDLESKGRVEDLTDIITYLLRADEESDKKTYLYVAKGGEKIHALPSRDIIKNAIEKGNFEAKLGKMKTKRTGEALGDYQRDLVLYGDGEKLITIPIFLRFTNGQWTSDYGQKGKAPTFYEYFETYFGASVPGSSPKGTIE